ncbi:MAG: hypothetical protein M3R24_34820 [Chloroflexota bacterium]|nr:hypothetical protein [Chloroflexota bacterium]
MSNDVFYGVMIEDTAVRSWSYHGNQLTFDLEASLWPGNPHYQSPRPDEWTCYKPATLTFVQVASVTGLKDMAEVSPIVDPNGTVDYGTLDSIELAPPIYRLYGPFGDVTIRATELHFVIQPGTD